MSSLLKNLRLIMPLLAVMGALVSISPSMAGTTSYKYDALGRVVEITYPNGTKVKYAYDKAGNRTLVSKTK